MRTWSALLVLLASPVAVAAQAASTGAVVQTYALGGPDENRLESIQLLTVPVVARVPVGGYMALGVSTAYARGALALASGERATVSGLTDTRLSVDVLLAGLQVSAAALLGTGQEVATEREAVLAGLLSADLLPFAVEPWGNGGGFAGDVAYAARLGQVTLGMAVGASTSPGTKPLATDIVYQPGREVRGRASLELPVGATGVATVALGLQRFTTDTYGGRNLYQSGDRWEAAASYAFAVGRRESAQLFGAVSAMEGGVSQVQVYQLDYRGFSQAVGDRPGRTVVRGGVELRLARDRMTLVPRVTVRALRREDGTGQGWLGSLGGTAEIPLARSRYRSTLVAAPSIQVSAGRAKMSDALEARVFGWEAGVTLHWSPDL